MVSNKKGEWEEMMDAWREGWTKARRTSKIF